MDCRLEYVSNSEITLTLVLKNLDTFNKYYSFFIEHIGEHLDFDYVNSLPDFIITQVYKVNEANDAIVLFLKGEQD